VGRVGLGGANGQSAQIFHRKAWQSNGLVGLERMVAFQSNWRVRPRVIDRAAQGALQVKVRVITHDAGRLVR
jgi:hypothetical protein